MTSRPGELVRRGLAQLETPGGSFFGDHERTANLAAGATYTVNRTFTVPSLPPGTYYLIVGVDRLGNVYEGGADGDNGIVSIPITVRTPDLRATAITATKTGASQLQVSWTVTNDGTAVARATWQDGVWISPSQVPGGSFAGDTARSVDLAPGASYTASKTVSVAGLAAGTHHVAPHQRERLGAAQSLLRGLVAHGTRSYHTVIAAPRLVSESSINVSPWSDGRASESLASLLARFVMENLPRFMQYAADFEKTLADDDWSRLRQYFADDAVYEVKAEDFPCSLRGPDAIFKGIKKSLDGFDRKFDGRTIDVTDGPEVDGETLRAGWAVTYRKEGKAPYVLRGRTEARYRDGKIVYLCDSYDPTVGAEAAAWMEQNGMVLDPSYV